MSCLDVAIGGILVFVAMTLIGIGFAVAEPKPGIREPIGASLCFYAAFLGVVVAFGATVVEIAVRILRS